MLDNEMSVFEEYGAFKTYAYSLILFIVGMHCRFFAKKKKKKYVNK